MKRVTVVRGWGPENLCGAIWEKYHSYIPKEFTDNPDYNYDGGNLLSLPLIPDSPELKEVLEIWDTTGSRPRLFSRVHYSKNEIEKTKYFRLIEAAPLEWEGKNAANYGTQYYNRCPHCKRGGSRNGRLLVDRKFVKNKKFGTLFPDWFASEETRIIVETNELTGISFGDPVLDYKGREIDRLYAVQFDNVLPPLSKKTFLEPYDKCEICGRQITYLCSDLQYESEKLEGAKDFNITIEKLDNFYMPCIVVSAKVRDVFKKGGIRQARFDPIALL